MLDNLQVIWYYSSNWNSLDNSCDIFPIKNINHSWKYWGVSFRSCILPSHNVRDSLLVRTKIWVLLNPRLTPQSLIGWLVQNMRVKCSRNCFQHQAWRLSKKIMRPQFWGNKSESEKKSATAGPKGRNKYQLWRTTFKLFIYAGQFS